MRNTILIPLALTAVLAVAACGTRTQTTQQEFDPPPPAPMAADPLLEPPAGSPPAEQTLPPMN